MRKAPLLPIAMALAAGIFAASRCTGIPTASWLWIMAFFALLTALSLLLKPPPPGAVFAAISLFFAVLGATLQSASSDSDWSRHIDGDTHLSARLSESPQPRGKTICAKADVMSADGHRCRGTVTLFFRNDSTAATLRYGDRLLLHCHPDPDRRSSYITSDHYVILRRDSTSLRARSEALRLRLLRRMQEGPMPRRHAAVAEALTLGWRADMGADTKAAYRGAGLAHLLAVSGLHVGLLAAIVGGLFFWTGGERRGRIIRGSAQLTAVWFFALLTGLAPSTLRAALMFSLIIVSNISGRHTPRLNLLSAAAIITLLAQPSLLFDTGWQLSYSAVAGLILARPVIIAFNSRLWQTTMVSLAATTATLPVSIATFHRFYPYFLIANTVVVPLAGIILATALIYMAVPCRLTAWPASTLLQLAESVADWESSLPGAVIPV